MPPPRGCVVVQKKNTCCPYLSCARLDAFYKIPATRRIIAYLDHYERESIDRVVNDNMLQRRSDDTDVDLYGRFRLQLECAHILSEALALSLSGRVALNGDGYFN